MSIDLLSRCEKIPIEDVPRWLRERGFHAPSVRWVWEWVRVGKLRSAKIGKRRYTDANALQEMVDRQDGQREAKGKQKRKHYGRQARLAEADAAADANLRRMGVLK